MPFSVYSEFDPLREVIVGIADSQPLTIPTINPSMRYFRDLGQYPTERELKEEVEAFAGVLKGLGVVVHRPENIAHQDQIFVRDIGFVVGEQFILGRPRRFERQAEPEAIRKVVESYQSEPLVPPDGVFVEGGDIVVHYPYVFVGVSTGSSGRTSPEVVPWLQSHFPEWKIVEVALNSSDDLEADPLTNVLHLDCAFQPLGLGHSLYYAEAFPVLNPVMDEVFGDKLIEVHPEECFGLWANVLSPNPETILSQVGALRLNRIMRKAGYHVIEIPFSKVTRFGGCFRCSSLPLVREKDR